MSAAPIPERQMQTERDQAEEKLPPRLGLGAATTERGAAPKHGARSRPKPLRVLGESLTYAFSSGAWRTLPSYLSFYILVVVASYASWQAHTHVTIIAPFQLPSANLPFSGEIVADTLQDALTSIHNDIEREREDQRLRSTEMDLPELRGLVSPKFGHGQVTTTRFATEVKGLSYEGIISVARTVMRTETTVSGDLILNGNEFILIARTGDSGPWESVSSRISAEGLKQASRDLAQKILATEDPSLAGAALLQYGQVDQALAALKRAKSLKPKDERVSLDLCVGFEAKRLYEKAIGCYQDVLKMKPSSPEEVLERLAQAYWLNGDRDTAIGRFKELAHKHNYESALLGLGKALDDTDDHENALKTYDEFLLSQPRNKLAAECQNRNSAVALVNRGVALSRARQHDEALTEYRKALKCAPGDVLILANIGVQLAEAGDLDAGIAQLQSVVDENVNTASVPFAFLHLGMFFAKKGYWRRSADQFRRAAVLRPNYEDAHRELAKALVHEGDLSHAIIEFIKVARLGTSELDRRYPELVANQWVGNTLRDQRRYAAAASAYRKAIRLQPDYGMAHCELGFVLEKQGHFRQAIQAYRAAILAVKSKVFDSKKWVVLAHQRLGEVLLSQGRAHRAEGIAELRKTIELDPKRLEPYLSLGKALYDE